MATRKQLLSKVERHVENRATELVDQLEEEIQLINKALKWTEPLIQKRNELKAAQRALLGGGSKTTGGTGNGRVHQEDVVRAFTQFIEEDELIVTPSQLADRMGISPEMAKGHLQRGKDERFIMVDRGKWALRRPSEGINSARDVIRASEGDDEE